MKAAPVFLTASLAANLLLGMAVATGGFPFMASRGADAGGSAGAVVQDGTAPAEARASGGAQAGDSPLPADTVSFATPEQVRDRMWVLGVPESCVRRALQEIIEAEFRGKLRNAIETLRNRGGREYWQTDVVSNPLMLLNLQQQSELREMYRANRAEMTRLLGPAPVDPQSAYLTRRDFLDPVKNERLSAIENDYNDLRLQVLGELRGFATPGDRERFRLIQEERDRDIAALLTPQEKEQYDLRQSPAATQLRSRLANFEATAEEYRALYAIYDAFERKSPTVDTFGIASGGGGTFSAEALRARYEAQQELNREIERALGTERHAEFQRAADRDYQTLRAAAQRFDLPAAKVDEVYALKQRALDASRAVMAAADLTPDQQRAALAGLASSTREQVRTSLGAGIGESYLRQAMPWLGHLDRGSAIRAGAGGIIFPEKPQPAAGPGTR